MPQQMYTTWTKNKAKQQAYAELSSVTEEYENVNASRNGRTFEDFDTDVSVRSQFSRADYEYFRANESLPKTPHDIIRQCNLAYDTNGIIHNVIDLMADFTVQGIRLVHRDPRIENFCVDWWRFVNGDNVSERGANNLYGSANVFINTTFGKISQQMEAEWRKAFGAKNLIKDAPPPAGKRGIPIGYNFYDPLTVEPIAGVIGTFTNKQVYAVKLEPLRKQLTALGRTPGGKQLVEEMMATLMPEVREKINSKEIYLPMDPESTSVMHYRKNDWDLWAKPLIYSVLTDVKMLNKMKLADMSALDGVITNVRLWNLGDFEHELLPTRQLINKLKHILQNGGPGTRDVIWGPELKFTESQTNVHQFLGMQKYLPALNFIYEGLGIPTGMTGSAGEKGMTNNAIQMKTLLKRLQYGRNIIIQFWTHQLKLLQKAMGWRYAPELMFDQMILNDEASEKKLLLELWDRDIISTETLLNKCEGLPAIEKVRINRESGARKRGAMVPKASPYHNPNHEDELKKIVLQQGVVTPSQVGLILEENDGEEPMMDKQSKLDIQLEKYKPKAKMGRPGGAKDKTKRKPKAAKPLSVKADNFATRFVWANEAFRAVADILVEPTLVGYKKKNLRSLTTEEKESYEKLCFSTFCALNPYDVVDEEKVYSLLQGDLPIDTEVASNAGLLVQQYFSNTGRQPSLDQMHQIQCSAYCLKYEKDEE